MAKLEHSAASEDELKRLRKLEKKAAKKQQKLDLLQKVEQEEDQAADKPEKKKKKKKVQQVEAEVDEVAAAANGTTGEELGGEHPEEQGSEGEKKSKKKKQKEKKRKDSAAEEPVVQDTEESAPPSKKSKKDKASNGVVSTAGVSGRLAEVGDAELARTSKPIMKQLYKEHPEVAALSRAQVAQLREERCTTVEGAGAEDMRLVTSFSHLGLSADMTHALRDFAAPSPIQAQVWPIIMSGRDLIGIAATGSGKTLAFGIPMVAHIRAQRNGGVVSGRGPFALVMAPTRELALQISEVISEAGSRASVRCVCVYGGVAKTEQISALKQGVEVVVGTPGRIEDLMECGLCILKQVTYVVLDEADRMLDLGFEPHIRTIVGKVRSDRQTLMFSATWPLQVQKLAAAFSSDPVKVTIGSHDLSASHSIKQIVEVLEDREREKRLLDLLARYHSSRKNRVLVFVLYKKEAPRIESILSRHGWKAAAIHGDISQHQRTQAVEQFKDGSVPLLIATDVAARGLDIPDVEVVINYSFPLTTEDYVHRIGRTGRAGKTGIAHTFFVAASDKPRAGELINVLREAKQEVPEDLLKFGTTVKKKESKMYGAHFKEVDFNARATKITFDD